MKRRFVPLLTVCLLLSSCSGLPVAREMGDMALLRTIGVDAASTGVTVTGSTGPRAKGLQSEGEPALTLTAERESLSGACLAMQGQSDSYVFFGYVDQLLIGEDLGRTGIRPVLDYFARDSELGLGAQLWLVRGTTAREAVVSGGEEGVDSRLETLQHDSEMGIAAISRTAGEVYADLLEWGSAFVPALSPAEEGGAILTERGYGVLKGDTLTGFLEGEEARGLELLAGGPANHILAVELPGSKVSAQITSAHTWSELEFRGNIPSALRLTCVVKARLAEYREPLHDRELERLQEELETREQRRLEAALEQMRALRCDCTGLGAKAAMGCPANWQAIQRDWPEWFARLPVEITVQVKIEV